jgi:hypothetical protein
LLLALGKAFPDNPLAIGAATLACVVVFGVVFERNKAGVRYIAAKLLSPLRPGLLMTAQGVDRNLDEAPSMSLPESLKSVADRPLG